MPAETLGGGGDLAVGESEPAGAGDGVLVVGCRLRTCASRRASRVAARRRGAPVGRVARRRSTSAIASSSAPPLVTSPPPPLGESAPSSVRSVVMQPPVRRLHRHMMRSVQDATPELATRRRPVTAPALSRPRRRPAVVAASRPARFARVAAAVPGPLVPRRSSAWRRASGRCVALRVRSRRLRWGAPTRGRSLSREHRTGAARCRAPRTFGPLRGPHFPTADDTASDGRGG